ncbi:MAG: hypothetical protein A3B81_07475 [Candidatus Muproteobacteria bacterium RIFCSPHIGHO2_02_FULL_65_16]|uniref:Cytochrome c domain-containing protein n=1 Tax=Candidatus Muproteobacteria bacterium RIFCSPHIGHO2_02_FULL_65_16 TaxID=1817766 RepID=A0A1F6TVP5_9PROT|nr:MAG: hypothetical protein A3B81_07475 [Candidatus Muproteobacteria bacterium RIFCSPHIGHO2_02_FULL_65_16]
MKHTFTLALGGALLLIAACGKKEEPAATGVAPLGADRLASMDSVVRGAGLYQEHCAQCHGPEAQGHPDWQTPGVAAAPPLNGTGNDWKRKKYELVGTIKNGVIRKREPVMPAWKGRLSDQEIEDIIAWFQALWPADVYENWRKANAAPPPPRG